LFSFCQILEKEKILVVLRDQNKVYIYLERLSTIGMDIQRNTPVKSLQRLGEDVLFAFDETTRALAVCASKKVISLLRSQLKPHLPLAISCDLTCLLSIRPSKGYRGRGVPSTLPHGIAKQ